MSNPMLARTKHLSKSLTDEYLTRGGVSIKTLTLFLFMVPTFLYSWQLPVETAGGAWIAALVGSLIFALITIFNPSVAMYTAPVYAVLEGFLLGGISKFYNIEYPGIPFQAATLTMLVFAVMWFIYHNQIIKVTEKFRSGLVSVMFGILIYYILSLLTPLMGFQMPLIHDSGWMGIGFSLVVCGVASFCFLLDFDEIDGLVGVAPKKYEWYCAFGLILTFVWLYLELLRLLSKIKD